MSFTYSETHVCEGRDHTKLRWLASLSAGALMGGPLGSWAGKLYVQELIRQACDKPDATNLCGLAPSLAASSYVVGGAVVGAALGLAVAAAVMFALIRRTPKPRGTLLIFIFGVVVAASYGGAAQDRPEHWTASRATAWYASQPWLVGSNYIPATAINELDMWQAETFDRARIERELGWAESIGLNVMRVFLHDLAWQQDADGFRRRIDSFLAIAARHRIRALLVLFDSCWDPNPGLGPQRPPRPGIHNSGWLQSPGANALQDPRQYPRLEAYVKGVVAGFANDRRVVGWDVWNEPDNMNTGSYREAEPANKVELVLQLLPKAFEWARAAGPSQPLTSGVWKGDWSSDEKVTPMERVQLNLSDVISFHSYGKPEEFEGRVRSLQRFHRPIICTEYLARGNGSTFQGVLPIAKRLKVAAINWGLVAGKTQTYLPWDSWQKPYVDRDPPVWHHEIFRNDGTPYDARETEFIREIVSRP